MGPDDFLIRIVQTMGSSRRTGAVLGAHRIGKEHRAERRAERFTRAGRSAAWKRRTGHQMRTRRPGHQLRTHRSRVHIWTRRPRRPRTHACSVLHSWCGADAL